MKAARRVFEIILRSAGDRCNAVRQMVLIRTESEELGQCVWYREDGC